ncbi:MAG TPA: hypothetical protein VLA52_05460 [Thermohalobaculum sp.]|nr:hypothetical protein [Thermohalobaculum sp.]
MPLNLQNGGNAVPHIRWLASTSNWSHSSEAGMQPFQLGKAVFDLAGIRTGWGRFSENEPPQWVWDRSLTEPAPRPADGEWKRGFRVMVLLPKEFGEERLREFATTGTGAVMGIDALYTEYEKHAVDHQGQVPVVAFSGATPTRIGKGNTNIPKLDITGWVDRPEGLEAAGQHEHPAPAAATAVAKPAAVAVTPPAAATVAAPQDPMLVTDF